MFAIKFFFLNSAAFCNPRGGSPRRVRRHYSNVCHANFGAFAWT